MTSKPKKKVPRDDDGPTGLWYFKKNEELSSEDPKAWKLYKPAESTKIENSYQKGAKTVTVGDYVVHLKTMIQKHKSDKSKVREVLRQDCDEDDTSMCDSPNAVPKLSFLLKERSSTIGSTVSTIKESPPGVKKLKLDSEIQATMTDEDLDKTIIQPPGQSILVVGLSLLSDTAKQLIHALPVAISEIERVPLDTAATRMRGPVRSFLHQLGRLKDETSETSCKITLSGTVDKLKKSTFTIRDFSISKESILELMDTATLSTVFGKVKRGPYCAEQLTDAEHAEAQYVAVTGYILSVFDNSYRTMKNSKARYLSVSIPGINLKYSAVDKARFINKDKSLNTSLLLEAMRSVWAHALHLMEDKKTSFPVLCAIGCGAFKGGFAEVPELWAQALAEQLSLREAYSFEAVIISLPTFGTDRNFDSFRKVFSDVEKELCHPVVLTERYSMVEIASHIARLGHTSAILNPSDVEAVRRGKIGMFWDGGHAALEEILALQTTLLLQHVGVNPQLWTDPSRHVAVDPKMYRSGKKKPTKGNK
eukprot:TRINITY_DN10899_c2_g1_i2.p1 TRINITY_DN10899_c2_g1~~TRINITY_DN10899_c2_g1_i2.p1  ORF type:complete len:563 (+),score=97.68 TRINITY_DN10899_c2_g1_i2:85-1689(+)